MTLTKFETKAVEEIAKLVKDDADGYDVIPFVKLAKAMNPDKIHDDHMVEIVRKIVIKKSTFNPLA